MNNKQYYSCSRNNYFFGKLMTVRDFESEQVYFNSKRRLGNRMLGGVGITCGLNAMLTDNKTISVEAGLAYDYLGREIVVPETVIKKLNVIKGFEENKDKDILYLCIEYKENLKETTFSVAGSGKSNGVSEEFNRINETYELFLTAEPPKENELKVDNLLNNRFEVYNKNGVKISLVMAKYVNPSKVFKISMFFEKENVNEPIKFSFDLEGEFFKTLKNKKVLTIDYQETEITNYKKFSKDYYLFCDAATDALDDFLISKEKFKLEKGAEILSIEEDIKLPVSVKELPIKELIINEFYSKHFDEIVNEVEGKYIYLAKFHLIENQMTYFIEGFEKHPFKQYLFSNELLQLLDEVSGETQHFQSESVVTKKEEEIIPSPKVVELPEIKIDNIVTGVERVNLGFNPKVGKSFFSYDFVHGIGEGNIAVILSIDNKANYLTDEKGLLVFGDKSIFTKEEISISAPNVALGAVINAEKGTIKIGVKLLEKTTAQTVDVRWWAFKPLELKKETEDIVIEDDIKVIVTPNTTKVKPLGQIRFEARIEGATSQEIRWAMAENNTGTIDNNGLYTAPSKEGVYEIKAYSVKFENKSESAYVVVSAEG